MKICINHGDQFIQYWESNCPKCEWEKKQMSGCHSTEVKPLSDNRMLEQRLSDLELHKAYQIDENRKISRRVDEIESDMNHIPSYEYTNGLDERIKDIEYRLSHIIALPSEIDIRLQDVERQLDKSQDYIKELKERMKKLEKDFESKLDIDYKKWCQYFNEVNSKKTPHKCPVCDGSGRYRLATAQRVDDVIDCRSCEGKGIVWG